MHRHHRHDPRSSAVIFALPALVGLLLSLAAHIAALLGVDVSAAVPFVWLLHVGVFVVFVPFVTLGRRDLSGRRTLVQMRAILPTWVIALGTVLIAYTAINFLLFILTTQGGSPALEGGRYVLENHGRVQREITASEYTALRANEIRGISGHWMTFYFAPFAYFAFRRKAAAASSPSA